MSPLDAVQAQRASKIRADLQIIADMIEPGTRVLDIGCSDGALLSYLVTFKQVKGCGIELSQAGVNAGVTYGLSVIQGDADTDLVDYPDNAFDYVILSQTLQATRDPRGVLDHLVRIGKRSIVSFPNFGYWRVRLHLLLAGRMPVTDALPDKWYRTPNIHLCTIRDFLELCQDAGIEIERSYALDELGRPKRIDSPWRANLLGQHALFMLKK